MRAANQRGFGEDKVSIREVPRPEVKAGCVLVRVVYASVHAGDHHLLVGRPYLLRLAMKPPEIPGMDFSGRVVTVGEGVTLFSVGDDVFGSMDTACGAFAEFLVAPERTIVQKPENVGFDAAAAVPTSACTALQALRKGQPTGEGDRVLINGASGGVGTFAVQLAKAFGAHVTAVCSTRNVGMVKETGADVVVDYNTTDVTRSKGQKYNRILDLVGNKSMSKWKRVLSPGGDYVAVALGDGECIPCILCSIACFPCCLCCCISQHFHIFMQDMSQQKKDLEELAGLLATGQVTPVIDKRYDSLDDVPEALRGMSKARGKTVIAVGQLGTLSQWT